MTAEPDLYEDALALRRFLYHSETSRNIKEMVQGFEIG
jgi:hypothetical protein